MTVAIIDYGSGNLRSVAKAFERVGHGVPVQVTSLPETLAAASHIVLPGVGAFADCMRGLKALSGMLDAMREQVKRGKPFLGICVGMQMLFERGHEHGVHDGLGWLEGEVVALLPSPLEGEGRVGGGEATEYAQTTPHDSRGVLADLCSSAPPQGGSLKIPHMGWNQLIIPPSAGGRLGGGHDAHRQGDTRPHPNPPPNGEGAGASHPLLNNIHNGDHAYFVHSYHAVCRNPSDVLATTDYGQTLTAVVGRGNIMGTQFHPEKSQETGLKLLGNFLRL